jgi:biotin synthase
MSVKSPAAFALALQKAEEEGNLSGEEILSLLSPPDREADTALRKAADRVREKYVGPEVHLRGIVEFSNFCVQNCLYCGLRRGNGALPRYRMAPKEILAAAKEVQAAGLPTLVLQSGEDPWFTRGRIADLVTQIKKRTGLAITLSLGERTQEELGDWRQAGADRYLLKHETASPALFRELRPGRELALRLGALESLRGLGYEVGSGNMVGLPGQSAEDLAEDIRLFKERDYDMIGIGPFLPHPQTPLAKERAGRVEDTLRVLAVTRLLTRDANLPATTATGILDGRGRRAALHCGANVIMPDMTPETYRRHYEIYPGRTERKADLKEIKDLILSLGREVGKGAGTRRRASPGGQSPP